MRPLPSGSHRASFKPRHTSTPDGSPLLTVSPFLHDFRRRLLPRPPLPLVGPLTVCCSCCARSPLSELRRIGAGESNGPTRAPLPQPRPLYHATTVGASPRTSLRPDVSRERPNPQRASPTPPAALERARPPTRRPRHHRRHGLRSGGARRRCGGLVRRRQVSPAHRPPPLRYHQALVKPGEASVLTDSHTAALSPPRTARRACRAA